MLSDEPPRLTSGLHASTGVAAYDRIAWSQPPRSGPLPTAELELRAVRHMGVGGGGTATASSAGARDEWDALLLNRGSHGLLETRIGGQLTKTQLRDRDVMLVGMSPGQYRRQRLS